ETGSQADRWIFVPFEIGKTAAEISQRLGPRCCRQRHPRVELAGIRPQRVEPITEHDAIKETVHRLAAGPDPLAEAGAKERRGERVIGTLGKDEGSEPFARAGDLGLADEKRQPAVELVAEPEIPEVDLAGAGGGVIEGQVVGQLRRKGKA